MNLRRNRLILATAAIFAAVFCTARLLIPALSP